MARPGFCSELRPTCARKSKPRRNFIRASGLMERPAPVADRGSSSAQRRRRPHARPAAAARIAAATVYADRFRPPHSDRRQFHVRHARARSRAGDVDELRSGNDVPARKFLREKIPGCVAAHSRWATHYPAYVSPQRQIGVQSGRSVVRADRSNRSSGKRLAYMPAVPQIDDALLKEFESADVLLFDGTFWSDDELIRIQGSGQTARQMGHVPVSSQTEVCASWRDSAVHVKSMYTSTTRIPC